MKYEIFIIIFFIVTTIAALFRVIRLKSTLVDRDRANLELQHLATNQLGLKNMELESKTALFNQELESKISHINLLKTELESHRAEYHKKERELAELLDSYHNLKEQNAILETKNSEIVKSFEEKIILLQESKEQMKMEFEKLSLEILEQKSKSFSQTQSKDLEVLLKPFREQIAQFATQSKEQFIHDAKERQSIKDEIVRLKGLNERLSSDAINLTQALKGENKTQGNWGEIVLERVLEESGLREGYEYETQGTYSSEEGKRYRPDVIVHLPEQKDIIIDSKVSLVAYDAFIRADDDTARAIALKEHLLSINNHIKDLSSKRYEQLEGIRTLDFVLLFMPIEGAFHLALENDHSFFKSAYEKNIIIVSPSTLLVTLRTIEHIWRREHQEQNAQMIAKSAEALYEKLVAFVDDMGDIGKQLERANKSYEGAMNKLQSGRGNLIKRAEDMRKLGLKPKKQLPVIDDDL